MVSANISGLNPYTQYQFRAIGVNKLGEGTPSAPSGIETIYSLAIEYSFRVIVYSYGTVL